LNSGARQHHQRPDQLFSVAANAVNHNKRASRLVRIE
jgi:hypothetical protein